MQVSTSLPKVEFIITAVSFLLIIAVPQYGVIGAFVLVIAYLRRSSDRPVLLQSIGFRRPASWPAVVLLALALGMAIELLTETLVNPLIERVLRSPVDLSRVDFHGSLLVYLLWVLIGFVLGGLLEEILFRGFLLTRVARLFANQPAGAVVGLVVTSAAFGLCHLYQGWSGVLSTGFIGLLLGLVFLATKKNLWYAILTHGFINLTGLTILYLGYYDQLRYLFFK